MARRLAEASFERRLLFYVALRTHRRNLAAFERDAVDWGKAFKREANQLILQMCEFRKLQSRQLTVRRIQEHRVVLFPGKYSSACAVDPIVYSNALSSGVGTVVSWKDALELPPDSCEIIITDPPYGLNANYDPEELATLYHDVFDVMLLALKAEGQLVFAVPDWTHVGRQIPFFATKQFITQQILAAAEKQGREVLQSAYTVPAPGPAFRPPYYWESDRALRRAILHFRIRGLQTNVGGTIISRTAK
jgi:hypothetical protein